ncbi:diglucosyl diacylglycerol synthase [Bacillus carboniphilus]|uniref:Diglucosyl diacylglycerol synthase n=1 Tax=Bacillus carboniphilus TaxID=86663 RepID=A0ABY9JZ09_9BACI|nr:diglucosyl diacylglycerol synthase [Bacillus carboniphilus]WLR43680.1 diglucosyl diacylglycerol synthase [Bacillus carboniphilus]
MKKKPKILILTANYGNGHIQVANSLEKHCKNSGIDVIVSDLYGESHPLIADITRFLYLKSFSIGKQFYRLFYYGVDKIYNKRMMNLYFKMGNKKLHQIIQKEKPDIIINTFPMIVVPEYRRRTGVVIPTFNVMTDFCLHKIWIHENIDKYYVASSNVKERLMETGTLPSNIKVTGIPIRPQFEKERNIQSLHKKYNLDPNKKILLIMAGAHGVLKNVEDLCKTFSSYDHLQTVVVCGNNHYLKDSLTHIEQQSQERVKVLGYVESIDELFRISDCMITKPGGITLMEASALKVPLILFKPVPGQEKENALYFEEKGAAFIVNKIDEIYEAVDQLLTSPTLINTMKNNIHTLFNPNATETIINDILEESEKIYRQELYLHS